MDKLEDLPFKVGQVAEARSFMSGFRGAWFRCKIKEIGRRKGYISHALEYFDFPDEKVKWTKLYQVPPVYGGKSKEIKRQLMVRPRYPPLCHESDLPCVSAISEATVIIDDVWEIGDLVDWWKDDCYWSGKVTQILGNGMLQIELPPPPLGEGLSYEVSSKDLRPSLDWSPEYGWRVPFTTGGGNRRQCARLIQPLDQAAEGVVNSEVNAMDGKTKDFHATVGSSFTPSVSSHISANSDDLKCCRTKKSKQSLSTTVSIEAAPTSEANMDLHTGDYPNEKTSMLDSVSSSLNNAEEDQYYSSGSLKRLRTEETFPLNSMRSDSIEAAIFDLEELVNKVKWLKGILEFGIPLPNDVRPQWKFLVHRASSTSK
ncbi:hypothetical protein LguiA_031063 [Lonicera macranthoides]